jgi:putative hydrolase of the HAD superfamily
VVEPTALFIDVGGVILTNGWDRGVRRRAIEKFGLDEEEFASRHEMVVDAFETGQITLDEYLRRTVFYRRRSFTRDEFESFLYSQSHEHPETLAVVRRLSASKRWLVATLNNESCELNEYRIKKFKLREVFSIFFTSCFLGVRKPDEKIYQLALRITQRTPAESVFIDDRDINIEAAARIGMRVVHYKDPHQLTADLARLGVHVDHKKGKD